MLIARSRSLCVLLFCLVLLLIGSFSHFAQAQDWPLHNAKWTIVLQKDINTVPAPHEPSDLRWLHLHRAHPTLPDANSNTIAPIIINGNDELDPAVSGVELRYLVKGIPVSAWLEPPFRFELRIDNPALAELPDGVHDLSAEVRGNARADFKPWRAFVHLSRDLSAGEPFGFTRDVPIINEKQSRSNSDPHFGPGVVYVNPDERNQRGYPMRSDVTAWQQPPLQAPLYQEAMAPHTELFHAVQMWWDHPAHPGAPFVRGMTPQHGEDHRNLRVAHGHERFPMSDGPRGVGWMSPYIGGQVDSQGRFAFAETGGRVGYLMPDGEIITVAGWRVTTDKDPIWWGKPTNVVRRNMQLQGNWLEGRGEFLTPLDVAIDPQNERIWYVVAYEDHVIWKVELPENLYTQQATVSVFAGDPNHAAGSADGNGQQARFNGPSSIVFDPTNDVMYVADQDNDAIRQITRSGQVTTLFGQPGMRQRLESQGIEWTNQLASRAASVFEVNQTEAASGTRPDIYLPQVIRVDSQGRLILLEIGFGAIRRIDPSTGVTETLGEVQQKHREFDRGWAWLDVDRYGNSGPRDGIYWCKFVSTLPGERFNEVYAWLPPEGGDSVPLFSRGTGLYPDGWGRRAQTNAPHYPWLVAVDPRGAVLMAGGGEHGVTRLRVQRDDDPIEAPDYWLGRKVWSSGSDSDGSIAANSFALKFGYSGQNYLGFTSAWGLGGASDEELLDAFAAPVSLRNDAVARQHWLDFIKPNTHGLNTTDPEPPTTPINVPTLSLPNNQWKQFSLPCSPTPGSTVNDLFGDDNLGVYGSDWVIWAYDSNQSQYQRVTLETPLQQGIGYWILQRSGADKELSMPSTCAITPLITSPACPVATGCFAVPVVGAPTGSDAGARLQMIGYPLAKSGAVASVNVVTDTGACTAGCPLGSEAANQIVYPKMWSYNGTSYDLAEPGSNFSPWAGYWAWGMPGASELNARILFPGE
ncbi:MAG: hypothetical protein KTR32_25415 [Granulosicoccus sp.]|nr:hypothetical protein [Granulosicoccus sp.]